MEFPLWRLRPEEAARIIILEPLRPVEHHKHWHKRVPRTHPTRSTKPRVDDLKTLDKAKYDGYWLEYNKQWAETCPMIGILLGPLLKHGAYYSQTDKITNPLGERERPPWLGMYSRAAFEQDVAYFEAARALNRENFILGQQGEGPYVDGLIYMRVDNLLLAEMEHCKARLRQTWAIMEQRRLEKLAAKPKEDDHWHRIGADESVAYQFKHSGYTVRKIGLHSYEVLMTRS